MNFKVDAYGKSDFGDGERPFCTHCNRLGHTKDDCHQLKGYPDWWDENRKGGRCRDRGGLVSEP
jgi:hypothetical protein